jgi:RNA polymerase sigma-70 factor, ECF subfamily
MAERVAGEDRAGRSATAVFVLRAQAGDQVAFESLIRPRFDRLLRLAFSIIHDEPDARDAVQDSCLLAWRELSRLRDPDRFEAWLWRILINTCRTTLRGRRRVNVREIDVDALPPAAEPAHPGRPFADEMVASDAIVRAFRRLDADKRTILVLHHVEDRSIHDIATLMRIPEGTAKWRLHSARRALERALEIER